MRRPARFCILAAVCGSAAWVAPGQIISPGKYGQEDKFRQLEELLPTPTAYRTASGAPGHEYWQQRADYVIDVRLDDEKQHVTGSETITYSNHSPDALAYLWLQIENNIFAPDSDAALIADPPSFDRSNPREIKRLLARRDFDGSVRITRVADADGRPLPHTIVKTMMRIDLPKPLRPGEKYVFSVDWNYRVNRHDEVGGRTACEYFPDDGNFIYELAHWFPRMVEYSDVRGWNHKQFLGRGEFSLEFGDYLVRITAPDDHVVTATGVLQNPEEVLTAEQRERLRRAESADRPMFIITPEEAKANEATPPAGEKTWVFAAENVRDFAWASSRKFIWDAQLHRVGGNRVWAMSFFPNEGEPLWSRYSTHAIIHTLDVYSRYTFDYPYPTAISVNGPVGGMEYPMICFNGPRPEKDGTYAKRTKYGLISVIIHEVGHNYFPMIVNSDERQWTWMDEGLNTFLQYIAEQEWEEDYPSRRGEPRNIVEYMRSTDQVPIMTNSESLLQSGANAYAKPATALNILRETVLGRELFDFAFKTYAQRWKFKRPQPADFFRTMEDASGIDLDWFWRGWFYTTDHCDQAITGLKIYRMRSSDLELEAEQDKRERDGQPISLSQRRNADLSRRVDAFPELKDFYNEYDELDVDQDARDELRRFMRRLEHDETDFIDLPLLFHVIELENVGGLVMPVILDIEYEDGAREELRIPAEIWRRDHLRASKLVISEKRIVRIVLDPHLEIADVDLSNNVFPPEPVESRFRMFKQTRAQNPMQKLERKQDGDDQDQEPGEAED